MAKKSVLKNYIYNLSYQILTLILPIVTTPYLARVLGAEGVGIYGYTFSIATYFILFGSLGVALYGQREIAYAQENKTSRKKIFLELIIFRFITMAISIVVYYFAFMRTGSYSQYYTILLLELIATAFDISWFFQGLEEFKKTVIRNILVRIVSVSCIFIFIKQPEDLGKFIFIYSLADLIGNLSLWLYLPKYLKGIKIEHLNIKMHVPQILLLFVPQISNQIYKMLDTTMIGIIIEDKAETGYYEQGQKVVRLLLTVVTSLGTVMIPRMASTFASGDKEKIKQYMKNSFHFVFFLSFPMMFGISTISDAFVPIFFGTGYDKVALLIKIICPIILLMGVANVIGTQYLLPTKRQKEYTISIVVGVIVNFFMNYFFIKNFASVGASIATVLSQLVVDGMQFYMVRNEVNFVEVLKYSWKYLISSIVMFLVCTISKFIVDTGVLTIILQMALGVITYFVMLIVLKETYIYTFLGKLKERIFKRVEAKS
jgi:O-antigen/teichoic acid export membrane protein